LHLLSERLDPYVGEADMTHFSTGKRRLRISVASVCILGGALALNAGAATPEPTVALKAAEQAIAAADQTRVADAASPELKEAREKLTAAQSAAHEKNMVLAEQLAVEARMDAELASAKTEASKARAVNDEIKQSTATLAQEMQRNTGAK
jgi:hypothetical protein